MTKNFGKQIIMNKKYTDCKMIRKIELKQYRSFKSNSIA